MAFSSSNSDSLSENDSWHFSAFSTFTANAGLTIAGWLDVSLAEGLGFLSSESELLFSASEDDCFFLAPETAFVAVLDI